MAMSSWDDVLAKAAEGGGGEAIPAGPYDAVIEETEAKAASTGSPMIVAVFKVESGPYAGAKVWNNFVLTDKSAGIFMANMMSLGLTAEQIKTSVPTPDLQGLGILAQMLIGARARITVTQKDWQGRMRNEITKIQAATGAAPPQAAAQAAPAAPPAPAPAPAPAPEPAPVTGQQNTIQPPSAPPAVGDAPPF